MDSTEYPVMSIISAFSWGIHCHRLNFRKAMAIAVDITKPLIEPPATMSSRECQRSFFRHNDAARQDASKGRRRGKISIAGPPRLAPCACAEFGTSRMQKADRTTGTIADVNLMKGPDRITGQCFLSKARLRQHNAPQTEKHLLISGGCIENVATPMKIGVQYSNFLSQDSAIEVL